MELEPNGVELVDVEAQDAPYCLSKEAKKGDVLHYCLLKEENDGGGLEGDVACYCLLEEDGELGRDVIHLLEAAMMDVGVNVEVGAVVAALMGDVEANDV